MQRLPSGDDPMVGQTALAVALGGVICPVPFLMSAAALRIADEPKTRTGRVARVVALATIVAQAAGVAVLVALVLR